MRPPAIGAGLAVSPATFCKMPTPAKKDRDEITVARSIFEEIVEITEHVPTPKEARARKGGQARSASLSPRKRKNIAKKAAEVRWKKSR